MPFYPIDGKLTVYKYHLRRNAMKSFILIVGCIGIVFVVWHMSRRGGDLNAREPINCIDSIEGLFPRDKQAVEELV